MKKFFAIVALLLLTANAQALEMAGVSVPETASIGSRPLQLNGCGIRQKFFIDVYLGALYTAQRVSSLEACRKAPGDKLIRMTFLYKKVEKGKIVAAFAEGFAQNAPEFSRSPAEQEFLALFTADFLRGDTVELELHEAGSVSVRHNGRMLGGVASRSLGGGILAIFLGEHPADEDLKKGMLGLDL